jgi:hypothetical protein
MSDRNGAAFVEDVDGLRPWKVPSQISLASPPSPLRGVDSPPEHTGEAGPAGHSLINKHQGPDITSKVRRPFKLRGSRADVRRSGHDISLTAIHVHQDALHCR